MNGGTIRGTALSMEVLPVHEWGDSTNGSEQQPEYYFCAAVALP